MQTLVAPKDKLEGSALPINQQAYIYRTDLDIGKSVELTIKNKNNGFYIFIIEGSVNINNNILNSRDAIGVWEIENISIEAKENTKLIVIEVPMD